MIIGIDGNEANVSQKVGIGQYAYNILTKIYLKSEISNLESPLIDRYMIYLKDQPREDMPRETDWWRYEVIGPKKMWTQIGLPFHLYTTSRKPDVFFSPSHYAPRWSPVPKVISIMDLSFLHFPDLFTKKDLYQLTSWTKRSAQSASHIFTISEYSKKDILSSYGIPEEKITVTYPGYNKEKFKIRNSKLINIVLLKYAIRSDYILFVGTVQPRKNIVRLIEAFERIKSMKRSVGTQHLASLQLIIVGKRGWMWEDILKRMTSSVYASDIKYIDFVDDDELSFLYQHARCFILPSLFEGFGIPVIEAMACGCPVVASNVSSLPEIVGDAGICVDPFDLSQIADAILQAGYEDSVRERLVKKGLERVKLFSWESCVEKTLDELHNFGNSPNPSSKEMNK